LHDSLEDCPKDDRFKVLTSIINRFDTNVAGIIICLTRLSDESYENYIQRICNSVYLDVLHVKLADLMHNLNEDRMKKLPATEMHDLRVKYNAAKTKILKSLGRS
jgi:hypothetical protein